MIDYHRIDLIFLVVSVTAAAAATVTARWAGWLAPDGITPSITIGTVAMSLGGWPVALLLLLFFVSSSLVSINGSYTNSNLVENPARGGLQVWCNGFWFTLFLLASFVQDDFIFLVSACSALAAATSDTWASELGSRRFSSRTYLITRLKAVEPGTDGGISLPGLLAGLLGSGLIAMGADLLIFDSMKASLTIFCAGFLGCLADSYFGAKFQYSDQNTSVERSRILRFSVDNNMVNWLATGTASMLPIILNLFWYEKMV